MQAFNQPLTYVRKQPFPTTNMTVRAARVKCCAHEQTSSYGTFASQIVPDLYCISFHLFNRRDVKVNKFVKNKMKKQFGDGQD